MHIFTAFHWVEAPFIFIQRWKGVPDLPLFLFFWMDQLTDCLWLFFSQRWSITLDNYTFIVRNVMKFHAYCSFYWCKNLHPLPKATLALSGVCEILGPYCATNALVDSSVPLAESLCILKLSEAFVWFGGLYEVRISCLFMYGKGCCFNHTICLFRLFFLLPWSTLRYYCTAFDRPALTEMTYLFMLKFWRVERIARGIMELPAGIAAFVQQGYNTAYRMHVERCCSILRRYHLAPI